MQKNFKNNCISNKQEQEKYRMNHCVCNIDVKETDTTQEYKILNNN